jgi:hypothetical protein
MIVEKGADTTRQPQRSTDVVPQSRKQKKRSVYAGSPSVSVASVIVGTAADLHVPAVSALPVAMDRPKRPRALR